MRKRFAGSSHFFPRHRHALETLTRSAMPPWPARVTFPVAIPQTQFVHLYASHSAPIGEPQRHQGNCIAIRQSTPYLVEIGPESSDASAWIAQGKTSLLLRNDVDPG